MKKDESESSFMDVIGNAFGSLSPVLQFLVLLGAAVAVIVGFFRWVRPKIKRVGSDLTAIRDTLVGRPAIHDSITDREIPGTALPSIGDRMASQEESMSHIAEAVGKLADATDRLTSLEVRVGRIEGFIGEERILSKFESVQMLRTMEAVAQEPKAGPAGAPGADGAAGARGAVGADGAEGARGARGATGADGHYSGPEGGAQ